MENRKSRKNNKRTNNQANDQGQDQYNDQKLDQNIDQRIDKNRFNLILKNIEPLTENQRVSFNAYASNKNLMLHGTAGTGKSFLSIFFAMNQILNTKSSYKKLVIVRSVVPTRDIGFMPGNDKQKIALYEAPYQSIFSELFGRGDAYTYLKSRGIVEFISTSFIRGITLNNCIIVVDEMSNCSLHELDSVITRVGKNCRISFCGDFRQSDFTKDQEKNGLFSFMNIIQSMKSFVFVDFGINDIVRSPLVKDYIIQKEKLKIAT